VAPLTPEERKLACQTAVDVASDLINSVCENEGSRVVRINSANISFVVPSEVIKMNGKSVDEILTVPWVKKWGEEMLKMTHPDWESYDDHKRTGLTKGIIERHLLPTLQV